MSVKSVVTLFVTVACTCVPVVAASPDSPRLIGEWPGFARGSAVGVVKAGTTLYAALQSGGLGIFNISPTLSLAWVGRVDVPNTCNDLAVVGGIAFLAL